jgi:hypothetical protein
MAQKASVFVPDRPFQSSLLFLGKARRLLESGALERFFTRVGPGLTHILSIEKPARNKHYSLLGPFVGYEENKVL